MSDKTGSAKALQWPGRDNEVPQAIFTDPELYELEMERIFRGPTWHVVGHECELPETGDYKTFELGGVPLIIIRDENRTVRVLINACAHRGVRVVNSPQGRLTRGTLQCIYHMWTYDLQGALKAATLVDEFPADFRKEDYGLRSVRTEMLFGGIFVTLSEATPPLREYLGDVLVDGVQAVFGETGLWPLGEGASIFRCNWKFVAENTYDSYHANTLHSVVRMVRARAAPGSSHQIAITCDGRYAHTWTRYQSLPLEDHQKTLLNDYSMFDIKARPDGLNDTMNLFPSCVLSDMMGALQIRYSIPRGVDKTEVRYASFARVGESDDVVRHRVLQSSNVFSPEGLISVEDACALERAQRGAMANHHNTVLRGVSRKQPPYGYAEEAGVRDFYAAYRRLLDG